MNNIQKISENILSILPQQDPFRFIEQIVEIDDGHIIGSYTFKQDEYFYKGHFPGKGITPGVILIETMAQTAVVAFGIHLISKLNKDNPDFNIRDYLSVFTDVEAEFMHEVLPGAQVQIKATKKFFRRNKLRSYAELFTKNPGEQDFKLAASATLAGLAVNIGEQNVI